MLPAELSAQSWVPSQKQEPQWLCARYMASSRPELPESFSFLQARKQAHSRLLLVHLLSLLPSYLPEPSLRSSCFYRKS